MAIDAGIPSEFFVSDHRACDVLWADVEAACDANDTERAKELWAKFDASMRRHFSMEEEVLFPAIEDAMGMHGGGPTAVMRNEHQQMRSVLEQMQTCAQSDDLQGLLDQGDTLLMVIQQHNAKEEGILYPMGDNALASTWAELKGRLESYLQ